MKAKKYNWNWYSKIIGQLIYNKKELKIRLKYHIKNKNFEYLKEK